MTRTPEQAQAQHDQYVSRCARLKADPTIREHGIANTYGAWGCRCTPCGDAYLARSAAGRRRRGDVSADLPYTGWSGRRPFRGPFGREWDAA